MDDDGDTFLDGKLGAVLLAVFGYFFASFIEVASMELATHIYVCIGMITLIPVLFIVEMWVCTLVSEYPLFPRPSLDRKGEPWGQYWYEDPLQGMYMSAVAFVIFAGGAFMHIFDMTPNAFWMLMFFIAMAIGSYLGYRIVCILFKNRIIEDS